MREVFEARREKVGVFRGRTNLSHRGSLNDGEENA